MMYVARWRRWQVQRNVGTTVDSHVAVDTRRKCTRFEEPTVEHEKASLCVTA